MFSADLCLVFRAMLMEFVTFCGQREFFRFLGNILNLWRNGISLLSTVNAGMSNNDNLQNIY